MGRSVSYPSGTAALTFGTFEDEPRECWDCEGTGEVSSVETGIETCSTCGGTGEIEPDYFSRRDDWDYQIDDFREEVRRLFPSACRADDWIGREDHVLMENGHARFGVSEYCGLVSYWMVPREDYYGSVSPLSQAWCAKAPAKFEAAFGTLRKVGSFSNGGGVYAPKTPEDARPDNLDDTAGHLVINGLLTDG